MPSYPTLSRSRPGPRRRSLLAGTAGAVLLTGCSDAGSGEGDGRSADAERLRARAARDSAALLDRYDAVIAAHAPLSARLRPLREEVARHAKAFGDGGPTPTPAATRAPEPPVPGDRKDALRLLATAERELARRRGKQLLDAPGELARLLASVAAAGAAHAYLLTEKGAEGNGEGDDK
ncbi:hypothetical protein [Streptomyces sp. AN091965]|uniref:hypothetical protein n=1 Tax=Streptomyces sp. AN091965 TaxID=2927803 RepID=UPI001F612AB2|nr:hypothetical protein [Streptomyces sp. AN091965]MCI3933411.1 hypothetical protein [Streptomyces sp. AN091965]